MGACFYLYYRCCRRVKSEPRITLIALMGCDGVLVGGGDAVVFGWWVV